MSHGIAQVPMAEPLQTSSPKIATYLRASEANRSVDPNPTIKRYLTVRSDCGSTTYRDDCRYSHVNIITSGMRVHSRRGERFRQWAERDNHNLPLSENSNACFDPELEVEPRQMMAMLGEMAG